ncbi:hypothetical protein LY76DRAFT_149943 [Colletotrichum caudatum]|nr:hypothetical protein LY76DRAFT_149943 [Colletotrichum caudatum]
MWDIRSFLQLLGPLLSLSIFLAFGYGIAFGQLKPAFKALHRGARRFHHSQKMSMIHTNPLVGESEHTPSSVYSTALRFLSSFFFFFFCESEQQHMDTGLFYLMTNGKWSGGS